MSTTGITPEAARRLQNLRAFWDPKMQAAADDAELVKVLFDRAKAAAKRAQRNGNPAAMHELAQELANWCAAMETRDATRQTRNAG